jgi:hypothetical protein
VGVEVKNTELADTGSSVNLIIYAGAGLAFMIAVLVVLICCVKSKQKRGSNKVIIDPSHPNEQTERNLVQLSPIKGIIIDDEAVPEEVKISEKSLEISSQKEVQPDIDESNYASNHTEGNLKTIAPESKEEIASEEKAPRK